jgi:TRAP-type uncharacterized transport system substrate-binding protein
MALQLVRNRNSPGLPYGDLRISMGPSEGRQRPLTLGSESPEILEAVGRGELDLASINPSALLTMAFRGTGPFHTPLPLRVVAVMPSFDMMAFALADRTGLTTLADVRERKYPLRVSLRDDPSNAPPITVNEVLGAEGFSLADIESWGGTIQWGGTNPAYPARMEGMRAGTIDAVFDEGIHTWGQVALDAGFHFARLSDSALEYMERIGWTTHPLRAMFPGLNDDMPMLSFSGWPLYTHAGVSDQDAYQMAEALYQARESIPWDSDRPVELTDLCGGLTDATPRGVPLHPGAERFYRERGALT